MSEKINLINSKNEKTLDTKQRNEGLEYFFISKLRIREIRGHEWWIVMLLAIHLIALPSTILICREFDIQSTQATLYLCLVIVFLFGLLFHFWLYADDEYEFETFDNEGKIYNKDSISNGNNWIEEETWNSIWQKYKKDASNKPSKFWDFIRDILPEKFGSSVAIYLRNRSFRLRKFVIGLLRIELFGWVTWTTASIIAISDTFHKISENPNLYLDFWNQNFGIQFSTIIDGSSYGLLRATLLGVITLFFTQMLKFYQANIQLNYQAAENAKKAAEDANKALIEIKEFRKSLHNEIEDAIDKVEIINKLIRFNSAFTYFPELTPEILKQVKTDPKGLNNIFTPLTNQLEKIFKELSLSREDETDKEGIEYNALLALQSTYYEMESLTFEVLNVAETEENQIENQKEKRAGFRFSTNYRHYAHAIQKLIETLECEGLDSGFEYYTILNGTMERFFNVQQDKADLHWSVSFLEEHCRKHSENSIKFKRCFLSNRDKSKSSIPAPNISEFDESQNDYILCDSSQNPKLFISKTNADNMLKGLSDETKQRILLDKRQYKAITRINENSSISNNSNETYTTRLDSPNPSYIIKRENIIEEFKNSLDTEGIKDLMFFPLTNILVEKYHCKIESFAPIVIEFNDTKCLLQ
jgi:hypothetical protein